MRKSIRHPRQDTRRTHRNKHLYRNICPCEISILSILGPRLGIFDLDKRLDVDAERIERELFGLCGVDKTRSMEVKTPHFVVQADDGDSIEC